MPVVLSYQDIGALGALSHQAGYAGFRRRDQELAAGLVANRQQQDTERMRIEAERQQADRDARLQRQLLNRDQDREDRALDLRSRALDQDNQQFYAGLASQERRAEIGAASDIANRLLTAQTQESRDARLHQNRLAEIEARGARAADGAAVSPEGVPNERQAEREVRQFGNLIPFGTGDAFSGEDAARRRETAADTAASFAALPTAQLQAYIAQRPDDQWTPYLRAIVQARQSITGGTSGVGAVPEGNPMSHGPANPGAGGAPTMPGALQGGSGFGLETLSDDELNALANDPALLNRYFGQR